MTAGPIRKGVVMSTLSCPAERSGPPSTLRAQRPSSPAQHCADTAAGLIELTAQRTLLCKARRALQLSWHGACQLAPRRGRQGELPTQFWCPKLREGH